MSEPNQLFDLATRVINHTNRHLFLTGRAGTGKTTFLRHIVKNTPKKAVVVAPTGVAAINAGGVTMHSFFQLPLGLYIADSGRYFGDEYSGQMVVNRHSLFKNMRMQKDKVALIRELELVIIDEVSMLRADSLDCIDEVLRHFRRRPQEPFGGVQMLFIGDLFQLPPVITNAESQMFFEHYQSPFFFSANALQNDHPMVIELTHIYRQRDEVFINLLNGIRNNNMTEEELEILHKRYEPWTQPEDGVIVLTTHNQKADAINSQKLEQLHETMHKYDATIKGEFSDRALPVDRSLQIKVGAQIMFIKNDSGEVRRFYNGKLAKVYHIGSEGDVWVRLAPEPGSTEKPLELKLEHHTWKSIKYKYNQETDDVDEEELGSFSQYPIRLAWAITIHKSQGLTFERAIIDAGQSFAAGQVYVALSRLTTLGGMILHSKISSKGIEMPETVIDFCKNAISEKRLLEILVIEEQFFAQQQLLKWFDFDKVIDDWRQHYESYSTKGIDSKDIARRWCGERLDALLKLEQTALNFRNQLKRLMYPQPDYKAMQTRVVAAKSWFDNTLNADILQPLQQHYKDFSSRARTKKYLKELQDLEAQLLNIQKGWHQAQQLINGLAAGAALNDIKLEKPTAVSSLQQLEEEEFQQNGGRSSKPPKGGTFLTTLEMFKEGKSAEEIATIRSLTLGTIQSHLIKFIPTGEVLLTDLMKVEDIEMIEAAYAQLGDEASLGLAKELLPESITYGMIRMVNTAIKSREGAGKS
ncbi:MAG: helix-turn-helix domain-containing protein [Chitinophagaceae bacterium]